MAATSTTCGTSRMIRDSFLVFVKRVGGVRRRSGRRRSTKRSITDTRYSHRFATVLPDGQWVAFVADASLRPDSVVQAEGDSIAQLPYDKKRDEAERNDVVVFVIPIAGGAPHKVATLMG